MKCIYQILNKVNGKFYIGSTNNFKRRKSSHLWPLRNNKHKCPYLQHAWNKYGEENFEFLILEQVEKLEDLVTIEQYYFDTLKPEYNILKIAGTSIGHTFKKTKEAVEKTASKRRVKVLQYDLNENLIKVWDSITEASKTLGLPFACIVACCKGTQHTTGNTIFRYRDKRYKNYHIPIRPKTKKITKQ